jgi:enoyl-CoA hydratase/carnithine racemase
MTQGQVPALALDGARATITLRRPRHHNRLEPVDLEVLLHILRQVEEASDLRVLVLTGSGASFSAGFHIGAFAEEQGTTTLDAVVQALEQLRVPTICALNGSVYGGATDLALACDFRIGVQGMRLVMPAARLGLHYYASGLRRFYNRLGLSAAKRLFLLAEPMDTAALLACGYLDEAVADGELPSRVAQLAAQIASHAPLAVQGMKQALDDIARGDANDAAIAARAAALGQSEDFTEGRRAWAEKRPPRFSGR